MSLDEMNVEQDEFGEVRTTPSGRREEDGAGSREEDGAGSRELEELAAPHSHNDMHTIINMVLDG